jgi:hypothetical protein
LNDSIFDEPQIKDTVFLILECITFLFEEVRKVEANYKFSRKKKHSAEDVRFSTLLAHGSQSTPNLTSISNTLVASNDIRQRTKINQRKTPFLSVAKWAINDARAFEEKLARLGGYIDILESLSRLIKTPNEEVNEMPVNRPSTADPSREIPPPPYTRRAAPVSPMVAQEVLRSAAENHERALASVRSQFSSHCQHNRFRRDANRSNRVVQAHQCGHICEIHPDPPARLPPTIVTATLPGISSSMPQSPPAVEIPQVYRVAMADPVYKVLPVMLKKYNFKEPVEDYDLFLTHGDQERRLGALEQPILLFNLLDKEGKAPVITVRKKKSPSIILGHIANPANTSRSNNGKSIVSTPDISTLITTHVKGFCWHVCASRSAYEYEIRVYYSSGESRKLWRAYVEFQTLSSEIEAEMKKLAMELQAMPSLVAIQELPKQTDLSSVVTSVDVERLHRWFGGTVERGLAGGIEAAVGRFLKARIGDERLD